jgi:hypothetical protein
LVSTMVSTGHHDAFFARNFLRMDNRRYPASGS